MTREQRRKAIVRRRIFLSACAVILAAVIFLIAFIVKSIIGTNNADKNNSSTASAAQSDTASAASSDDTPSYPAVGPNGLDANFNKLLLVNGENPLPENYNYEENLIKIPNEYLNNSWFKQIGGKIDKDVWPYMQAMIDAAWADGVKLYVWSPYRSYSMQKDLFDAKVQKCKAQGIAADKAETEAAKVVARPGTSEHHTGLAADFNMADEKFENTEMYTWLKGHAADYGFIMRYSGVKEPLTGVIHEQWHWRFVGINTAKEINRLDMCLEEYTEYLKK